MLRFEKLLEHSSDAIEFTMPLSDGRQSLDHKTLEAIRTMALQRIPEDEHPSEVIASHGFHRCTIQGRLKAAAHLDGEPKMVSFNWINGKNPRQYGFDFGLRRGESCAR